MLKNAFLNISNHHKIFAIALPMMLSNISVPLLGLVDTAVIGHLPESYYLAGVAIGSMVVTLLFGILVFLRMSTTGLVAQTVGANNHKHALRLLVQSIFIALLLAVIVLMLQAPVSSLAFYFVKGSEEALFYGQQYFDIRIWSAPATLINMVLLGWLLGMQNAKAPMLLLIVTNGVNIVLDLLFVIVFEWGVSGVAWASLCADYIALACGLFIVIRISRPFYAQGELRVLCKEVANTKALSPFLMLNRDIFIRTVCLQAAFIFMTIQAAKLGDDIVSANSVLMHFLMIISFSMDGLAYAVEALVGKSIGQRSLQKLRESIYLTLFWATIFSFIQLLLFYFFGAWLIEQITSIQSVQLEAIRYLPWLLLISLTSMLGFVLDGVFIGMTRGRDMRNTVMFSLFVVYFPVWFLFSGEGNHALWIAMNAFMLARGISLLWIYKRLERKRLLIV